MKEIKLNNKESILEYWKKLQIEPEFEEYAFLISEHPLLRSLSFLTNKCFFILDHARGRFAYMSDSIQDFCGYTPEDYYKGNFDFSVSAIEPPYRDFAFQISHHIYFEELNKIPTELKYRLAISKDGYYIGINKERIRFLQKSTVLKLDKNGNVYLTLHTAENITHLKKGEDANLILSGTNFCKIFSYNIHSKILTNHENLSDRELDILKCLQSGEGSKQIAAKHNISPHTVDTHRRNLLNKLNCVDSTALVTYCKLCGVI